MDTLHSVLFYAFAAVTVAGGAAAALLEARARALGLALVAVGLAALEADLGAAFAGAATLVALGACALFELGLAPRGARVGWGGWEPAGIGRQLGAVGAALVFAVLAYLAFRGSYAPAWEAIGGSGTATVGLLLLNRDALATEAVAAALLLAVVGGGLLARRRSR